MLVTLVDRRELPHLLCLGGGHQRTCTHVLLCLAVCGRVVHTCAGAAICTERHAWVDCGLRSLSPLLPHLLHPRWRHGHAHVHVLAQAPPDVLAAESRVSLKERLGDVRALYILGLALDFCVLDSALTAKSSGCARAARRFGVAFALP